LKRHHFADILAILTAMTDSSAAFQKVLSWTSSETSRDVGSIVLMQKEAI
jgi:hypothetical protein